jgi:hypothetical protein
MIIRALASLLFFFAGGFLGFFVYSGCVAYLIEENLPNQEIAEGFVETFRMVILIGSLRIGELEEYVTPIAISLIFALLVASLPFLWTRKKPR